MKKASVSLLLLATILLIPSFGFGRKGIFEKLSGVKTKDGWHEFGQSSLTRISQ